ncbi:winged helix DNA-binding domain-containing protein [Streptomyces montanisoli]|uniref:AlkZ family DNA glycosylase n=1 Tax=Streptomyces montanisoli TaxID=2798581 RepID=A0A940MHQ0_9ACTN|nr:winged helix DNA-binding domain-containing protein [Streptomyces montanisoli]MBP0458793.1 AlkZ family DNA glycosylase [Streptomyces montanisoli]
MRQLGASQARLLRAWSQGVAGDRRATSVPAVLERCLAVQAQDLRAAALGIRARGCGLTEADVHQALGAERTLVRGWFMRGTLYLVPAGDAGRLRELLAPRLLRRSERRYRELRLGPDELALGERVITEALADGPLTRDELAARMTEAGLDASGQVPFHLVRRSALLGTACFGPVREDGSATYVLARDWLPASAGPSGADAVGELLRRYLAAHGPATTADFATWSGLGLPAVRSAWERLLKGGELEPCRVGGVDQYALPADAPRCEEPTGDVRLLPAYDNYLVGYADRRLSVEPEHEHLVRPGGGQISPTVVVDGLVRGVWRRDRARGAVVEPFDGGLPGAGAEARDAEALDVEALGVEALGAEALDAELSDVCRFLAA